MTSEVIYLATANDHKAEEIRAIASLIALRDRPADIPEAEETGDTLEANARIKARSIVDATGESALSDDTGLEVDALNGAPGVHSARYAGEDVSFADNYNKLLLEMGDVPEGKRRARFRTVAMLCRADGSELIAEGAVSGTIATEARGEGWGYDPVFIPDEGDGRTFAEMTESEKNFVSHRGRAFRRMQELLGL